MPKIIQQTNPLLPEILTLHGKWRAHKPALITIEETLSWSQFTQRMNQVANGLVAMGLEKGDRVVILMSNSAAMAECLMGAMMGGIVSAPLNTSVTDNAIQSMIIDSGAKAIICSDDQAERIEAMLGCLPKSITLNRICAGAKRNGWASYRDWRNSQSIAKSSVKIEEDDYLNIIYSSGTTGQPKGIVHTHQGRRDWAYDLAIALRYDSSSRFLATIGLYSNITWVGMLCTLLTGGTLLIADKFDATALWGQIERDRITHLSMVPVMYERMMAVAHNESYNTKSMRGMMSAGSPLRAPVKAALFERFNCGIIELYGLTEGVITTLDPEDAITRLSSVGLPLIGTDIKILDENDNECLPGTSGEIVSAGRIVMPEYFGREDATRDSLWIDDNGTHWLRTGDIGYLDEEGYLYIVDRKKDMILSGGQNIYPQDIEAVIAQHPNVQDVAVIGVTSAKWGETPLALVTLRNGKGNNVDIQEWANKKLGKQQRITGLELIKDIPRNPNGKILKRDLRKKYKDRVFD